MKRIIGTLGTMMAVIAALAGTAVVSSCCGAGMFTRAAACMGMGDHGGQHDGHESATSARAQIGNEVVCPVDGMKLRVAADTPSTEHGGKVYYFCSDADQRSFLKEPDRYVGAGVGGHAH